MTLSIMQVYAICLECSNFATEGPAAELQAKAHVLATGHRVGVEKKETYMLKRMFGVWPARAVINVERAIND